jgi:hypothetical protein
MSLGKTHPRMIDTTGVVSLSALTGSEEVLINDGSGTTKKTTTQDIADLGGGGGSFTVEDANSIIGLSVFL